MSSYSTFRRKRATELRRFATALQSSRLSCDVGAFSSAVVDCKYHPPNGADSWGYSLSGVQFNGPAEQDHIRPVKASLSKLELNVLLEGKCVSDDQCEEDPLTELGVEVVVIGSGADGKKLKAAWCMDRHEAGSEMKLPVHPTYHFQYGGMQVKNVGTGGMVITPVPRLAHPPLDAILAIDFILSNYFHDEWVELREGMGQYYSVVKSAQRLLWKPYVNASSTGWSRINDQHPWQVVEVWPQLIPDDGLGNLHG